jgi:hypothetical protein
MRKMLPFQAPTLTILAVLITLRQTQLPPVMAIGLIAVCVAAVMLVLVGEFRRGGIERNEKLEAEPRRDVERSRPPLEL